MSPRLLIAVVLFTLGAVARPAHAQCPDEAPVDCGFGCCVQQCCSTGCCDDPNAPYCCGDYCSSDPSCSSSDTSGATSGDVSAGPTGGGDVPSCSGDSPVPCGAYHCTPIGWACCDSIGFEDRMCPPGNTCVCGSRCPVCAPAGGGVYGNPSESGTPTSGDERSGGGVGRTPYDADAPRTCAASRPDPLDRSSGPVLLAALALLALRRSRRPPA